MPSNTYRVDLTTNAIQVFGASKNRTAWTVYNAGTNVMYWSNNRFLTSGLGTFAAFRIPSGGTWTLSKDDGDDPTKEVWMLAGGTQSVYVYEGFKE